MKEFFLLFLIIVFFLGLYLYSVNFNLMQQSIIPTETSKFECPNMLIRKENKLYLFNKKNPSENIVFNDMNEYNTYLEMQKKKGIDCPILYVQQENNAQGNDVFVMYNTKNDISNIIPTSIRNNSNIDVKDVSPYISYTNNSPIEHFEAVTDAGRDNPPYNANNYPSFDPQGLYIGKYTELDVIHASTEKEPVSDNPMDTNWGGIQHTEKSIESGKYDENNVYKTTYYTPINGIISMHQEDIAKKLGNTFAESFQSFW